MSSTSSPPVTLAGTATLTNGSAAVTFSTPQTLAGGAIVIFSSQPGIYYSIAAATSVSTSATLSGAYSGISSALALTTYSPSPSGIIT